MVSVVSTASACSAVCSVQEGGPGSRQGGCPPGGKQLGGSWTGGTCHVLGTQPRVFRPWEEFIWTETEPALKRLLLQGTTQGVRCGPLHSLLWPRSQYKAPSADLGDGHTTGWWKPVLSSHCCLGLQTK